MPAPTKAGSLVSGPGDSGPRPGRGPGDSGPRPGRGPGPGSGSGPRPDPGPGSGSRPGSGPDSGPGSGSGREEWGSDDSGLEGLGFENFNIDDWPELGAQADSPQPTPASPEPDPGSGSQLGQNARLTAWVRGRVQGVGFRWWVRRNALELGLRGFAENLVDGRVKVVAEGGRDGLGELLARLEAPGTPGHVAQVTHRWDVQRGNFPGFVER
jgi:acylphosphatase